MFWTKGGLVIHDEEDKIGIMLRLLINLSIKFISHLYETMHTFEYSLSQGWILLCLQFELVMKRSGGWVIRPTTSLSIAKCNGKEALFMAIS